jgi:hypothetical protein
LKTSPARCAMRLRRAYPNRGFSKLHDKHKKAGIISRLFLFRGTQSCQGFLYFLSRQVAKKIKKEHVPQRH